MHEHVMRARRSFALESNLHQLKGARAMSLAAPEHLLVAQLQSSGDRPAASRYHTSRDFRDSLDLDPVRVARVMDAEKESSSKQLFLQSVGPMQWWWTHRRAGLGRDEPAFP